MVRTYHLSGASHRTRLSQAAPGGAAAACSRRSASKSVGKKMSCRAGRVQFGIEGPHDWCQMHLLRGPRVWRPPTALMQMNEQAKPFVDAVCLVLWLGLVVHTAVPGVTRYVAESWDAPSRTADTSGALAPGTVTCTSAPSHACSSIISAGASGAGAVAPLCCSWWVGPDLAAVGYQDPSRLPGSQPVAAAPT
jgi:hypothetical protein